ncbi:MAG: 2-oxo acid dehydrogenase subunit E2 [Nocardioides sp.]
MVFTRRSDGIYLGKIQAMRRIVPYLMPTRTGSSVYYEQKLDVGHLLAWLEETNAARPAAEHITLFHVFLAALARTLKLRPEVNRFIVGRRTYQHTEISISFIVKTAMDDDAPEGQTRLVFTGDETVAQVRDVVTASVTRERSSERGNDDKLVDFFASWPRPVLGLVSRLVTSLDYHNALPGPLRDSIPLYTSVYVVNTGSIGIDAPFHHLFDLGSASVFMAIGRVAKEPVVDEHDQVVARDRVTLRFTLDERASDGFYFARTAEVFRRLVEDPQLLATPGLSADEILGGWPRPA